MVISAEAENRDSLTKVAKCYILVSCQSEIGSSIYAPFCSFLSEVRGHVRIT